MNRVIVIGCPGAGKSTFARKLRDITGLPLYYLDSLYHKPDRTNITSDELDKKINKIMNEKRWIIDGNYQRTLESRIKKCDTIFLMDIVAEDCLLGVESRIGIKREDMPWIELVFEEEFKKHIIDFPSMQLPKINELLNLYGSSRTVIIFKSRKESDLYIEKMKEYMNE